MVAAADDMRGAVTTSFLFHGALLLLIILGLPHLKPPPLEITQAIPIDIVDVGPVTTTQVQGTGNIAQQNNNTPAPAPPKPIEQPTPAPVTSKVDERKALEDIIGKEAKQAPKEDPQQFNSLLKNLSQQKPADAQPNATPQKTTGPAAGAPGISADKLTISQTDALRRQIEGCWDIPVGGRDIQDMVVQIHVIVNADRTVQSAEILNADQMSDPFFRALAESAQRAILNPKCSPLDLPPDKMDLWHDTTLSFSPKDVL